ncbi:hypothetical protein A4A49_48194, partial [Nicotiana attenuata]
MYEDKEEEEQSINDKSINTTTSKDDIIQPKEKNGATEIKDTKGMKEQLPTSGKAGEGRGSDTVDPGGTGADAVQILILDDQQNNTIEFKEKLQSKQQTEAAEVTVPLEQVQIKTLKKGEEHALILHHQQQLDKINEQQMENTKGG